MLFKQLGIWELLIILAIVVLIFGVGRLGKLGKDLGEGISAFRKGLKGDQEEDAEESTEEE
jgi:sec-independent protein translocase protein TatA